MTLCSLSKITVVVLPVASGQTYTAGHTFLLKSRPEIQSVGVRALLHSGAYFAMLVALISHNWVKIFDDLCMPAACIAASRC